MPGDADGVERTSVEALMNAAKKHAAFERCNVASGWLDVVRSEFHEIAVEETRRRAVARNELEFVVPNQRQTDDVSTNRRHARPAGTRGGNGRDPDRTTGNLRQAFAVPRRPGARGRKRTRHAQGFPAPRAGRPHQEVPDWIAERTGVPADCVAKLGDGYFPSLGVMPNRVFPFVATRSSEDLTATCRFVTLRDAFSNFERLRDLHTLVAVSRTVHALGLWKEYAPA